MITLPLERKSYRLVAGSIAAPAGLHCIRNLTLPKLHAWCIAKTFRSGQWYRQFCHPYLDQ
jgi:hypothetical protein